MGRLYDSHSHLCGETEERIRREQGIVSLTCASSPEEAVRLKKKADDFCIPTYGLHPWQAGRIPLDEMLPFIKLGAAIGEIGMDSVWCSVPLKKQEQVFLEQLELAVRRGMPVILHTKGQEERISQIIRHFPATYLVHWYSSMEHLKPYLEMDCFFTAGPDLAVNPAVRQVVRECPANRLLVETDGWSAVKWALGEIAENQIGCLLKKNMGIIGVEKHMSISGAAAQIEENFFHFLGITDKNT